MKIPFVGQTYQATSPNIACDRCINFYPELNPQDAKDVISLLGTPGTALTYSPSGYSVRGMYVTNNTLFVVERSTLYSISTLGTITAIGTLNTNAGRISMKDNGVATSGIGGNQLAIVDGVNL